MPKPAKKPEKDSKAGEQIVAQNRAASYNFHLLDRFEAGLVLHGTEVKALARRESEYSRRLCGFQAQRRLAR